MPVSPPAAHTHGVREPAGSASSHGLPRHRTRHLANPAVVVSTAVIGMVAIVWSLEYLHQQQQPPRPAQDTPPPWPAVHPNVGHLRTLAAVGAFPAQQTGASSSNTRLRSSSSSTFTTGGASVSAPLPAVASLRGTVVDTSVWSTLPRAAQIQRSGPAPWLARLRSCELALFRSRPANATALFAAGVFSPGPVLQAKELAAADVPRAGGIGQPSMVRDSRFARRLGGETVAQRAQRLRCFHAFAAVLDESCGGGAGQGHPCSKIALLEIQLPAGPPPKGADNLSPEAAAADLAATAVAYKGVVVEAALDAADADVDAHPQGRAQATGSNIMPLDLVSPSVHEMPSGDYEMLVASPREGCLRLYRSRGADFPRGWRFAHHLLCGLPGVERVSTAYDPSKNVWFVMSSSASSKTRVFHAHRFSGPYRVHPSNDGVRVVVAGRSVPVMGGTAADASLSLSSPNAGEVLQAGRDYDAGSSVTGVRLVPYTKLDFFRLGFDFRKQPFNQDFAGKGRPEWSRGRSETVDLHALAETGRMANRPLPHDPDDPAGFFAILDVCAPLKLD